MRYSVSDDENTVYFIALNHNENEDILSTEQHGTENFAILFINLFFFPNFIKRITNYFSETIFFP